MARKVLLLNSNYEVLDFLDERRAIKLFFKGKVEVLSEWPGVIIFYSSGSISFPAILRLKYYIRKNCSKLVFSRTMVFKRDQWRCQYCGKHLTFAQATMDHIVPKKLGGKSSFTNCITACYTCNNKKGSKTLEESGLKILHHPIVPTFHLHYLSNDDKWHSEWNIFIKT
jgi:5-methylcytosine-specific restriction endonuclease McrA